MIEVFIYADFVETGTGEPSKIFPGRRQPDTEIFTCPACDKHVEGGLEHGQKYHCPCGLVYLRRGNSLEVYKPAEHRREGP